MSEAYIHGYSGRVACVAPLPIGMGSFSNRQSLLDYLHAARVEVKVRHQTCDGVGEVGALQ